MTRLSDNFVCRCPLCEGRLDGTEAWDAFRPADEFEDGLQFDHDMGLHDEQPLADPSLCPACRLKLPQPPAPTPPSRPAVAKDLPF